MKIGYKRVSTLDQNTARQLDGIPVDKTFEDRAVDQFDFILRCGGLGRSLETILHVIRGQY